MVPPNIHNPPITTRLFFRQPPLTNYHPPPPRHPTPPPPPLAELQIAEGVAIKDRGNALFKEGNHKKAITTYRCAVIKAGRGA